MENPVRLNVGGKLFIIEKDALVKSEYFKIMLTSSFMESIEGKEGKEIFIDRDPKIFEFIFEYLQDSKIEIPKIYETELDFYQIPYQKYPYFNINFSKDDQRYSLSTEDWISKDELSIIEKNNKDDFCKHKFRSLSTFCTTKKSCIEYHEVPTELFDILEEIIITFQFKEDEKIPHNDAYDLFERITFVLNDRELCINSSVLRAWAKYNKHYIKNSNILHIPIKSSLLIVDFGHKIHFAIKFEKIQYYVGNIDIQIRGSIFPYAISALYKKYATTRAVFESYVSSNGRYDFMGNPEQLFPITKKYFCENRQYVTIDFRGFVEAIWINSSVELIGIEISEHMYDQIIYRGSRDILKYNAERYNLDGYLILFGEGINFIKDKFHFIFNFEGKNAVINVSYMNSSSLISILMA
jgi:hypothetical protein